MEKRDGIKQSLGQSAQGEGKTGSRDCREHANLAAGAIIAVGGKSGGGLVGRDNRFQFGAAKRFEHLDVLRPRHPEHGGSPELLQGIANNFGAGTSHIRSESLLTRTLRSAASKELPSLVKQIGHAKIGSIRSSLGSDYDPVGDQVASQLALEPRNIVERGIGEIISPVAKLR